jgi:excisionase family DNA binding protein
MPTSDSLAGSPKAASNPNNAGRRPGGRNALHPAEKAAQLPRLAYSLREFCAITGSSKTFVQKLIISNKLQSKLIGHRRFIPAEALDEFLSPE